MCMHPHTNTHGHIYSPFPNYAYYHAGNLEMFFVILYSNFQATGLKFTPGAIRTNLVLV